MSMRLTRRRFLQSTTIAGGVFIGAASLRGAQKQPPSETLNVAVVGVAGQGAYNLGQVAGAGANIVALCDVDENRAGTARKQFPKAVFEVDFRKVVDRKDVDAVVVATPDHTHAPITMAALKAGKHVYCEKPLTHTVHEARAIAAMAAKQKRVTQMGTQIHAGSNYRRVVELIQSGVIGVVREVHTWTGTSYWGGDHPTEKQPVPAGLHYDLWQGPAPERPYHKDHLHFVWRKWWDYGGGALNDMACHHVDLPFWALKLRAPAKVTAEGAPVHKESAPKWLTVQYEFESRGWLPGVNLTWYDSGKRPALLSQPGMPKWGDGNLFVGSKGMMLAGYGAFKLLPEKDFPRDFKMPKETIPNSIGHHKEWVEACKTGGTTTCNFDYSGALTETVLLGTVSYRSGKSFSWDAMKLKTSEPAANEWLHKEYRKGWTLESVPEMGEPGTLSDRSLLLRSLTLPARLRVAASKEEPKDLLGSSTLKHVIGGSSMMTPESGNLRTRAWMIPIALLVNSVGVAVADEAEERHITLLEQLGGCVCRDKSRPGEPVVRVHLFRSGVKDHELLNLKLFKQLEDLNLTGTEITDKGLAAVAQLQSLTKLQLWGTETTDKGLEHLVALKNLRYLNLRETGVTDVGVEHLKKLKHLEVLYLDLTALTDRGLKTLNTMDHLRELILQKTNITDEGLAQLKDLKGLRKLYLDETPITDSGLKHLAGMTELRSINLSETKITDKGLEQLKAFKQLRYLSLGYTEITDAGLAALKDLENLEELYLHSTKLTDKALVHLRGLKRLRILNLDITKVEGKAVDSLGELKRLRTLSLWSTEVTSEAVKELQKALPDTEIVLDKRP